MNKTYIFITHEGISISAFPVGSEEYENNHMIVKLHGFQTYEVMCNVVRNVLIQTGTTVILD